MADIKEELLAFRFYFFVLVRFIPAGGNALALVSAIKKTTEKTHKGKVS